MWNSVTWEITKIVNNYGRFGVSVNELVDILDSRANHENNIPSSSSSSSSLSWPHSAFPFLRPSNASSSVARIQDPQHQQQTTRFANMCNTMGIVKGNTAMALALTETLRPQSVHKQPEQQSQDGNSKSAPAVPWVAAVKIKKSSTAYKMRQDAIFAFERILFGDYSKFELGADDGEGGDGDEKQNKETLPKRRPRTNENSDVKEQEKMSKAKKENLDRIATQFARLRKFDFGALQNMAGNNNNIKNNNKNTKSKNNKQQNPTNDSSVVFIPGENIDEDIHLQNLINKACDVALLTLPNNDQQQLREEEDDDYELFFISTRFLAKLLFPSLPLSSEGLDLLIAAGRLGISQMAFGRIVTSGHAYRCLEIWKAHGICVSRKLWPLTLNGDKGCHDDDDDDEEKEIEEDQQNKNSKLRGKSTVKSVFVNGDKEPFEPRYFMKESDPFLLRLSHQQETQQSLPSDQDLIHLDQLPFLAPPRILNILTFAFRKEGFGNKMTISNCIEKYFSQQQQQKQQQHHKQELVKTDDTSRDKNWTLFHYSPQFSKILAQMGFRISHSDSFNKTKLAMQNQQSRFREAHRSWIEYPTHFLSRSENNSNNNHSSNNNSDNDESNADDDSDGSGDDQTGETSSVVSRSNNTTFSTNNATSTVMSSMAKNLANTNNNFNASLTGDKQNVKLLGSKGGDCIVLASPLPFPPHRHADSVLVNEYLLHHRQNNNNNNAQKPIAACTSVWDPETGEEFSALTKHYFNANHKIKNNNNNNKNNRPILNETKLPFGKSFKNCFVVADSVSAATTISSSSSSDLISTLVLQRVADTILSLINNNINNNDDSYNSSPTVNFISGHALANFHDGSVVARFQAAVLKAEKENDTTSPFHPTNLPFSRLTVHRTGQHPSFVHYRKDAFRNEAEAANAYKIARFRLPNTGKKNKTEENNVASFSSSDVESNDDDDDGDNASDALRRRPPPFDSQEQDDADVRNFEQNLLKRQEQNAATAGSGSNQSSLLLLHPNSIDRLFPASFSQAKAGQLQLYSRTAAQFGLDTTNNNNNNSNIAEPHERPIKWCFIDWILPTLLALWKISLSDYSSSKQKNDNNNPFEPKYKLLEILPRLPLSVVCTLGINDFDSIIDDEVTADEFETPLGQLSEKFRQRLFPGKIEKEQLARNFGHALHSLSIFGFVKFIESTNNNIPHSTSSSSSSSSWSIEFELNVKVEFNQKLFCQETMMPAKPNSESKIHVGTFSLPPVTSNQNNNNNNTQLTNQFFVQILKMCSNVYEILVGLNNKENKTGTSTLPSSSESTTAVQFLFTCLKFARRNQNAVVAGNSSPHHLIALRKTLDRLMMEHFKGHRLLPESILTEAAEQFSQIPGYSRARKNTSKNNDSELVLTMPSKPTPKLTKTSLLEYISCDFPLKNHAAKFSTARKKKITNNKQSKNDEDGDDSLLPNDDDVDQTSNMDERADDEEISETDDETATTTTTTATTSSSESDDSRDDSSSSSSTDSSSSGNSSRKKKRRTTATSNNKSKKSSTSTPHRKIKRRTPRERTASATAAVSADSAPKPKPKFCGKYTQEGRNTVAARRGKRNRETVIGRFDDVPHWTQCGFFVADSSKLLTSDVSKFFRRSCSMLGLVARETLERLRQAFEDESKGDDSDNNNISDRKTKGKKAKAEVGVTLSIEEKTLSDLLNLYCQFHYGGKLKEKMDDEENNDDDEDEQAALAALSWNQQDVFIIDTNQQQQNDHDDDSHATTTTTTTTEQKQTKRQIEKCKRHLLSILFANDCDYMVRMADSAEFLLRDMFPPKIVRAAIRSLTDGDRVSTRVVYKQACSRIHRVSTTDAFGASLGSSVLGEQRCPERRSWTADFRGVDFALRVARSRQKMQEIFLMPSSSSSEGNGDGMDESKSAALNKEILCHPSSGIVLAQSCFDQIMQNVFGSVNSNKNSNNQIPALVPCFDLRQVQLDKFYERKWKLKQGKSHSPNVNNNNNNNNNHVVVSGEQSNSDFLNGTLDFLESGVSIEFPSKQDRSHTQKVFEDKLENEISKLLQDASSSIVPATTEISSSSKAIENFKKSQQSNLKTSTTTSTNCGVNASAVNHETMSTLLQSLRTATTTSSILENVVNGIPPANATDPNFHHRSTQLLANTFAACLLKQTATFRCSNSLLNRWIVALNSSQNLNSENGDVVITEAEREKRLEFTRSVVDLGEELSLDATTSSSDDDDEKEQKNNNKSTKEDAAPASSSPRVRRAKKTKIRLSGGAFRNPNDDVNYTNILFVISAIYDLIFDFPGTTEKMISVGVRSPEIISKDELEMLLDLMVENGFVQRSGYCYRSADDIVEDDAIGTNGVIPSWAQQQQQENETEKFRKYYYKPTSSVMDPSKLVMDGF